MQEIYKNATNGEPGELNEEIRRQLEEIRVLYGKDKMAERPFKVFVEQYLSNYTGDVIVFVDQEGRFATICASWKCKEGKCTTGVHKRQNNAQTQIVRHVAIFSGIL